jgi:hypothetical protein
MSRLSATACRWTGCLLAVFLAGCGGNGPYPVSGRVEFDDGQPATDMAGCTLTFTSAQLGKSAVGDVLPDGTFRLTTLKPGDGAFPGKYKVTVQQPHPNPERRQYAKPVVDLIYEDEATTPLEATVEAKENSFTFKLKRIKSGK